MKKMVFSIFLLFSFPVSLLAAPRPSIFSTSSDWERVSGLHLREYQIPVKRGGQNIGKLGWELYYLDGFPCYGQSEDVRAWIDPVKDRDAYFRIVCLAKPTEIKLAWREAGSETYQNTTTGILTCKIGRDMIVNLSNCERGPDWDEFGK
ncbi:MAG: hypothetical protein LBO08_01170 [Rickettsiales bacterium]|jgi:hypothetical protein|nr:hypothetical protein [Rickettsiales bacterium]